MTESVYDFIKEHLNLINENKFDLLYQKAIDELYLFKFVNEVTEVLTTANINPLEGLTTIPQAYMHGNKQLKQLTVPDNIQLIDEEAFSYCSNLESVYISPSVKSIGYDAFHGTPKLKSVTIPEGVLEIHALAFYKSGLEEVTLPDSIISLHPQSFDSSVVIRCSPGSYAQEFAHNNGFITELLY